MEIRYRKAALNKVTDALSRNPVGLSEDNKVCVAKREKAVKRVISLERILTTRGNTEQHAMTS